MLVEYPFNQIPLDWRMLPFNLLVTVFYGVANVFVSLFTLQKTSIYDQLDWFGNPVRAIENFGVILLIQIIVFSLQWFLTEKYKLPKYRSIQNTKTHSLNFKSKETSDGNKANETEHLGDQSTRYLLKDAMPPIDVEPVEFSQEDKSPASAGVQKSLRESITSMGSQRGKRGGGKYNPYLSTGRNNKEDSYAGDDI